MDVFNILTTLKSSTEGENEGKPCQPRGNWFLIKHFKTSPTTLGFNKLCIFGKSSSTNSAVLLRVDPGSNASLSGIWG